MKILQVLPFFTPARGGSVIAPYNLSRELAKRGHKITIITTDFEYNKEYTQTLEDLKIKVFFFHCIANLKLFLITPSMKKWLKKEIRNFDVVHMHNYRTFQNIIVYHYTRKYEIPYIIQAHGSVLPFFQKQILKKLFDLFFGYKILKNASKIIALTKNEAEQYKKIGVDEDKIEIIPNGINISEYNNLPKKGEFRKKYKIKKNEKIILYLGRIHKIKGIDLLVNAFADISKLLKNVKLVIAGPDGGFLLTLKKQIEDLNLTDKILFTGPLYEKSKLEAYVDADVYVLPSVYEVFGITLLEACACGTPIITTKNGREFDWIEDKVGYIIEYDIGKLRDVIIRVLSDEGLRRRFGERGKKLVRDMFGWDNVAKEMEEVYEESII